MVFHEEENDIKFITSILAEEEDFQKKLKFEKIRIHEETTAIVESLKQSFNEELERKINKIDQEIILVKSEYEKQRKIDSKKLEDEIKAIKDKKDKNFDRAVAFTVQLMFMGVINEF